MDKKLKIVGCGPGSPDFITPAALKAVESANVIMGAQKFLDLFPHSTAAKEPLGRNLSGNIDAIADHIENNRRVAVLVSGDPGVFSIARLVVKRYGRDACEVIPGISSAQVAFARLGLDWQDCRLVSAHKEVPALDLSQMYEQFRKLAIFAGSSTVGPWIASSLKDCNPLPKAVVFQNLTLSDEKMDVLNVVELESFEMGSSSIIIVFDQEDL